MSEHLKKYLPGTAKILIVIAIMVVSMAWFISSINQAMAAQPIRNATVTNDQITLGDVFEGIEDKDADFVLAPAPMPDAVLTWNARTLNRIAKAFDLPWRASAADRIHIRRLASLVTEDDLEDTIIAALRDQGLTANVDLDFVGSDPVIILPHDIEPTIEVISSSYNQSRQTFSATLRTADNSVKQFSGVAYPLIPLPVLATPARRGDIITNSMVKTIMVRADLLSDEMVITEDDLIGMTPRRVIAADIPVTYAALSKPRMVDRGDLITMQYENGPIRITAIAKAMQSGTKGDIIRVMNVDSKRTLEAKVTGLREATILN